MSSLSVGDMAQSFNLTRSGAAMKASLQRLSNELVSGLTDDAAAHLSGDFGPLAGIQASLARLEGYKSVTTEAGLYAETMQTALGRIVEMSGDLSRVLLSGASPGAPAQIAALGAEAAQKFESAIGALNTRVGDRNLFSGQAATTTPLPSGAELLDTLQTVVAGATSAADVQTALDDWFSASAGYAATYKGDDGLVALPLAPGDVARLDITALDPAIRDTLKGLAMAALLDRGVLTDSPQGRSDLVRRSGEALLSAQTGMSATTARLGSAQAHIDQAAQQNSAESSALSIAASDLLAIDGYEVASQLQQTQVQLEILYTLTSRLSRLNLVNFL